MPEEGLKTGLCAQIRHKVEKRHLATEVGTGLVNVFSTSMMIAGMEAAAVAALEKALPAGMTSVGVHVDVEHKAATPPGMNVQFTATLKEISANGKTLLFAVEASDDSGLIGAGKHWRVLVDKEKFEARAMQKLRSIE